MYVLIERIDYVNRGDEDHYIRFFENEDEAREVFKKEIGTHYLEMKEQGFEINPEYKFDDYTFYGCDAFKKDRWGGDTDFTLIALYPVEDDGTWIEV